MMVEKNTPLINELLRQLAEHPDLETWKRRGKIPPGTVKNLCLPLRTDPQFIGQPGRFYSSAISLVEYIYKSWLKLQQRWEFQLQGQERWLSMLKSDEELEVYCDRTLEDIKLKATQILDHDLTKEDRSISSQLFSLYDETEDTFTHKAFTVS